MHPVLTGNWATFHFGERFVFPKGIFHLEHSIYEYARWEHWVLPFETAAVSGRNTEHFFREHTKKKMFQMT